jgi:putative tricarboxylic transport membrane protein
MRKNDVVCGLVALAFGGAIAVEAQRIPDPGADVIGPGAFPFWLGLIIAACGLALCVRGLGGQGEGEGRQPPVRWLALGASLVLLVAYTLSLARLGFLVATALFVPACLALLGTRGLVRLTLAGVAVSVAVFVLFGLVLGVDLPKGRLLAG